MVFNGLYSFIRRYGPTLPKLIIKPGLIYNYFLNVSETQKRPIIVRSHPTTIEIEITNICNQVCSHCIKSHNVVKLENQSMSFEMFKLIFSNFPMVLNIILTGVGEPTLHQHFCKIVHYIRQNSASRVSIFDNGTTLSKTGYAEEIINSGLSYFNISLDAASNATYSIMRKGKYSLDQICQGIDNLISSRKKLKSLTPVVSTNFHITSYTFHEMSEYFELCHRLGLDEIIEPCFPVEYWLGEDIKSIDEKDIVNEALRAGATYKRLFGREPKSRLFRDPVNFLIDYMSHYKYRTENCGFLWNHAGVASNGWLKLCCWVPSTYEFTLGNLAEKSFMDLWNSELAQDMRRSITSGYVSGKVCEHVCQTDSKIIKAEGDSEVSAVRRRKKKPSRHGGFDFSSID